MLFYLSRTPSEGVPLGYLMVTASHALAKQSYEEPYLPNLKPFEKMFHRNPKENLDGFGIYFVEDDVDKLSCVKSKYPIINVETGRLHRSLVPHLATSIKYNFSFLRNNNFKKRNPNYYRDVQPYRYGNLLFTHNGGFNTHYAEYTERLRPYIDPDFLKKMQNINVDSKWLFGLFSSQIDLSSQDNALIESQIKNVLNILYDLKHTKFNISLNIILSDLDNDIHIALRYRTCKQIPPTLYYNRTHPLGYLIASEPIDYEPGWHLMKNHLIIIKKCKKKVNRTCYSFQSIKME